MKSIKIMIAVGHASAPEKTEGLLVETPHGNLLFQRHVGEEAISVSLSSLSAAEAAENWEREFGWLHEIPQHTGGGYTEVIDLRLLRMKQRFFCPICLEDFEIAPGWWAGEMEVASEASEDVRKAADWFFNQLRRLITAANFCLREKIVLPGDTVFYPLACVGAKIPGVDLTLGQHRLARWGELRVIDENTVVVDQSGILTPPATLRVSRAQLEEILAWLGRKFLTEEELMEKVFG